MGKAAIRRRFWVPQMVTTMSDGGATEPSANLASEPEICSMSVAQLTAAYRRDGLSPVEVTRAHLDRISRGNPTYAAFVSIDADRAMAAARQSATKIRTGQDVGALEGIPLSVKDLIKVAGLPMTAGSKRPAPLSAVDADAVAGWRRAGAVILGTNTLHEYAFGGTSVNEHTGTPRNPWDASRICGGSSGGSAAAVAAGFAVGAMGTETGNSIRRPAAFCGVVGFKPTYGRVSRSGVVPLASSLDHVGVLARSVEDAAIMVDTINSFDGHDLGSHHSHDPGVRVHASASSGMSLGIPSSMLVGLDPLIEGAFTRAVHHLGSIGISVRTIDLPIASVWTAVVSSITMHAEGANAHERLLTSNPEAYGSDVLARLLSGLAITKGEYARAQTVRELIRHEILSAMSGSNGVDAIIAPAVPDVAPLVQPGAYVPGDAPWHVGQTAFHLQRLPSLLGLPAGSAPVGWSPAGLPLPIQVFGRPWEDSKVLWLLGKAMDVIPKAERRTIASV